MNNKLIFALLAAVAVVAVLILVFRGEKKEAVRSYREVEVAAPQVQPAPEQAESPEQQETVEQVETPAQPVPAAQPAPGMPSLPAGATVATPSLTWKAPAGWTEQPGNNMRMATFEIGPKEKNVECTIVAFPGDAGGVEANIKRWAGQLNLQISDAITKEIMKRAQTVASAGGHQGLVFDFDELAASRNTPSILAAMFAVGGQTVFVKMMGDRYVLLDQKGNFLALCNSLQ